MEVLREAKRVHPDAWWWVKADGCDIVGGLKESIWSGDIDQLHQDYMESLRFLAAVGIRTRRARDVLLLDLKHLQADLEIHTITYLSSSKNLWHSFFL